MSDTLARGSKHSSDKLANAKIAFPSKLNKEFNITTGSNISEPTFVKTDRNLQGLSPAKTVNLDKLQRFKSTVANFGTENNPVRSAMSSKPVAELSSVNSREIATLQENVGNETTAKNPASTLIHPDTPLLTNINNTIFNNATTQQLSHISKLDSILTSNIQNVYTAVKTLNTNSISLPQDIHNTYNVNTITNSIATKNSQQETKDSLGQHLTTPTSMQYAKQVTKYTPQTKQDTKQTKSHI